MKKILTAIKNPVYSGYRLYDKFSRLRLFGRYAQLSRQAGFDRLYLILSFDCDIAADIAVVEKVHDRLERMGVRPVYAVPGELLKKGKAVYRRIMEAGGEFINHGYTEHTYFDANRGDHASCFFYDQLPRSIVREDIVNGDSCLKDVLGVSPKGFRAPHFGTFQQPEQLHFMHRVLHGLRYEFSTSTTPYHAFRHGPVFDDFGLMEIPVSGMGSSPLTILDSWGCFKAPDRLLGAVDYLKEGSLAASNYHRNTVGLLNYYADPSHIHDQDVFFETVQRWCSIAEPITYSELMGKLKCNTES